MASIPGSILMMSEHEDHIAFMTETLQEMGLELTVIREKHDLIEALQCCLSGKPDFDLVLLDGHRPDILQDIRARQLCEDIPVLMVLSEDEVNLVEQYIAMGAKDYLRTPFNKLLTQVRITACLDEKRAREQLAEREKLVKMERDLQIAQQIQMSFLTSEFPKTRRWEIGARFYPARTVAGDWYDAFYLANKRRIGIVVADVCDKGLPSALFMALCRSLLRAFAQQNYSLRWMDDKLASLVEDDLAVNPLADEHRLALPSAGTTSLKTAVQLTNAYILENHSQANMFFTLFFGVIDPATGNLSYVNAGHNPPFIVSKDGAIKGRLKPTGPAVGIFPDADFGIQQTDMEPGDILVTFTDGVPDAHSPEGKLFTDKRLIELASIPAPSADELLDRIIDAVQSHIADEIQFDDITMIAARYKLPKET